MKNFRIHIAHEYINCLYKKKFEKPNSFFSPSAIVKYGLEKPKPFHSFLIKMQSSTRSINFRINNIYSSLNSDNIMIHLTIIDKSNKIVEVIDFLCFNNKNEIIFEKTILNEI